MHKKVPIALTVVSLIGAAVIINSLRPQGNDPVEPSVVEHVHETAIPETLSERQDLEDVQVMQAVGEESEPQRSLEDFRDSFKKALEEKLGKMERQPAVDEEPPTRRLIKDPKMGEVIELTFKGGEKLYLPNTTVYDVSNGEFKPKEL